MKVRSNGCTFHCHIEGQSEGPWLTLSHGLATDLSMWDDFTPYFTSHYRILRYDARGHGGSEATPGDYSFDLLTQDVIGLLDALEIEQTHFIGLSMGGMVGMGLALDHPERVSSVVVCDARAEATSEYRAAWEARIQKVTADGIESMVEPSVTRWLTASFQTGNLVAVERLRQMVRRTSVEGFCGSGAALRELDFERRLDSISVPVLYLVGADDQGAPPPVMRRMQSKTPLSQFVEVPSAGHVSVIEQPARCALEVGTFIESLQVSSEAGT